MGFGEAISSGFSNYVNFTGRAVRSEYWFWVLFTILVAFAAGFIDGSLLGANPMAGGVGVLSALANLALLLPGLSVGARRLHDLDRSGWWLLLAFIPLVGAIILIVWFCTPGTPGSNRFGSPRATVGSAMAQRL